MAWKSVLRLLLCIQKTMKRNTIFQLQETIGGCEFNHLNTFTEYKLKEHPKLCTCQCFFSVITHQNLTQICQNQVCPCKCDTRKSTKCVIWPERARLLHTPVSLALHTSDNDQHYFNMWGLYCLKLCAG